MLHYTQLMITRPQLHVQLEETKTVTYLNGDNSMWLCETPKRIPDSALNFVCKQMAR